MTRRRRLNALVLGILVMMLGATGIAGAEPIEPCLNYVHREEAGRVEIDLRPDPQTGAFLVDGRATSSPKRPTTSA